LIALSPINRYLLATTNYLTAAEYFGVGFIRHVLPDPFYWLLGYWYGDRALRWAVDTYPMLRSIAGEDGRALEQPGTRKILYPLAFLAPNTWVSLLCGAARLPFATFALLNATGTLARLVLFRWLGAVFDDEIETVIDFIGRYQRPATIISIVVVFIGAALQFRKGKGELFGLTTLDDIEDDDPV
jgi:membrane protein DedA with SNARE-associated domain